MAGNPVSAQFFVSALHKSFDSRLNVQTLVERDAINGAYRYKGMVVYVKETNKHYEFNFTAAESAAEFANNLNWKEVSYHLHSNQTAVDKLGMDSNGNPLWEGQPLGGGGGQAVIRDTLANIQLVIIPAGAMAYATDTGQLFVGDGTTAGGNQTSLLIPQVYDGGTFLDGSTINAIDGGSL